MIRLPKLYIEQILVFASKRPCTGGVRGSAPCDSREPAFMCSPCLATHIQKKYLPEER